MKIVHYCDSNKQMGRSEFRVSVWSPADLKEEVPAPREAVINASETMMKKCKVKKHLWVKNVHSRP